MGIFDTFKKKKKSTDVVALAKKRAAVLETAVPAARSREENMTQDASAPAAMATSPKSQYASVILHPAVSEKAARAEAQNQYAFVVKLAANKSLVKQAIKELYGVTPLRVRMMNYSGKATRFGRLTGRRANWKKAIVTLPKGQTIRIHEGV